MSLVRNLVQPLVGALARGMTEGGRGGINPAVWFAGGVPGVAFDLSDSSSVFQDSAGTTAIAAGAGIGQLRDKSGNGKHATQTSTASKALWQPGYATFDGFDDFLVTPAIDFTGTDKVTVVVGVYKASDAATGVVCEFSASSSSNTGVFALFAPLTPANTDFGWRSGGSSVISTATVAAAPASAVISGTANIAAPSMQVRRNGVAENVNLASQGTGTYGNYPLYIGRRAGTSLPFNGRIHRLLIIGRALTAAELSQAERWAAQPTGVTL